MGLDMYLEAERYVDLEARKKLVIPSMPETQGNVSRITILVGYWQEANHIHKWFVDNIQEGWDECQKSGVSRTELTELRDACNAVLGDHSLAEAELPTGSGFFFRDTEYGEYYFKDLEDTVQIIEEALKLPDGWEGWDFSYRASW